MGNLLDDLDDLKEKKIKISFIEISKLSKLKGNLIPLINDGYIEYEEFIPVIDELIKRYSDGGL